MFKIIVNKIGMSYQDTPVSVCGVHGKQFGVDDGYDAEGIKQVYCGVLRLIKKTGCVSRP